MTDYYANPSTMTLLYSLKKHLALPKTSWQICLLAAIGGVASAGLIILFTASIDFIQQWYLPQKEDYTSLDAVSRFDLPIIGALLILLFAKLTGYKYLRTGIPFVLHRLKVAHGVIPLRNTLNQFVGSVLALASGFSVGREGPAVHLGAACSSFIGSFLKLPHNAIRTLCACGIAAGISASFNTPLAAVIFVMEVIMREYKVHVFIPVMIASIVGSLITSHTYGPAHKFEYFNKITIVVGDYPLLIMLGILLGILAFAFNRYLTLIIKHSSQFHIISRFLFAALITGALGAAVPHAMGTDLTAIAFAIDGNVHYQLLLGLLLAKLIMTIVALGLGVPGGIIGPILSIGAIGGVSAAAIANHFFLQDTLITDYALMGMAGFMAATLNAPLAALIAVVELSNQLEIIIPAMIVITTASLTSGQFFNNRSILVMQLEIQGLIYRHPPIEKSLLRIGAMGIMQENFRLLDPEHLSNNTNFLNVSTNNELLIVKESSPSPSFTLLQPIQAALNDTPPIIKQQKLIPLSYQATLAEAYALLKDTRDGGVYLYDGAEDNIIGVLMFVQIRRYLIEGKAN
ncbi:chloride channel protein [Thalassotalea profundi]|uniref:Chloride channel protein n=1 Tax=Thalassotalea profundi TaxID=2036687 RepID=A0ABQ3IZ70_9GAMM|nr:chloride channel protein [Thalassotalea profundi]GHE98946.1 chloride channel protein [Thalassotalea profundi]